MRQSYQMRKYQMLEGVIKAMQSNPNMSVSSFQSSEDMLTKSTRMQINQFAQTQMERKESNPQYYSIQNAHKQAAALKGDLISQKFLTRQELIKNYKQPPKKETLWENNPFNNLTIGQYKTQQHDAIY